MALLTRDFHVDITGFNRLLYSLESERWVCFLSSRVRPGGSSKPSIYCWGCDDREVQTARIGPLSHPVLRDLCSSERSSRPVLPSSVACAELQISGLWSCLQLHFRGREKQPTVLPLARALRSHRSLEQIFG